MRGPLFIMDGMRATSIENIKSFTTHLFAEETFDSFLAVEASFSTLTDVSFDGHINPAFLTEEEQSFPEYREGIVSWKQLRPLCFDVIKGKKVPLRFKIVFKMPRSFVELFLSSTQIAQQPEDVMLFLNLVFQDGALTATTGVSLKQFSLDKSVEIAWDEHAAKFLQRLQA